MADKDKPLFCHTHWLYRFGCICAWVICVYSGLDRIWWRGFVALLPYAGHYAYDEPEMCE